MGSSTTNNQGSKLLLPPLICSNEPKCLDKMTLTELRQFISTVLKTIVSSPGSRYPHDDYRPAWWPSHATSCTDFLNQIPPYLDKAAYLREAIAQIYQYHNQEDTLNMFDLSATEDHSFNWNLRENANGTWVLFTGDNRVLWQFPNSYWVIPLLALKQQQEVERENRLGSQEQRSGSRNSIAETSRPNLRSAASVRSLQGSPSLLSNHAATPGGQEVNSSNSPGTNSALPYPARRPSLIGATRPALKVASASVGSSFTVFKLSPAKLKCATCDDVFYNERAMFQHKLLHNKTREQSEKAGLLFGLGLVPREFAISGDLPSFPAKKHNHATSKPILSAVPVLKRTISESHPAVTDPRNNRQLLRKRTFSMVSKPKPQHFSPKKLRSGTVNLEERVSQPKPSAQPRNGGIQFYELQCRFPLLSLSAMKIREHLKARTPPSHVMAASAKKNEESCEAFVDEIRLSLPNLQPSFKRVPALTRKSRSEGMKPKNRLEYPSAEKVSNAGGLARRKRHLSDDTDSAASEMSLRCHSAQGSDTTLHSISTERKYQSTFKRQPEIEHFHELKLTNLERRIWHKKAKQKFLSKHCFRLFRETCRKRLRITVQRLPITIPRHDKN